VSPDGLQQTRPAVRGDHYAISTGHPLATAAGQRIFQQDGNATDAGVAAGLALNVTLPDRTGIGGVAPILVLDGASGKVRSIRGLGRWPRATDVEALRTGWGGRIPPGVLRCVTPAAMGAWLTALARFGRLRLEQVLAPAIALAERGMPVWHGLHRALSESRALYETWPGTRAIFYPDGDVPVLHARLRQPELAQTLRRLAAAASRHDNRERGIWAAYDLFYRGEIAHEIAAFFQKERGWLNGEDLAGFEASLEEPCHSTYQGLDLLSGGPWCQGPVTLQILNLLETEPLAGLEHNSAAYIHFCTEAFKLVFADRGAFYGDPDWVRVPLQGLLSKPYAAGRALLIDRARAQTGTPAPGDPWAFGPDERPGEPGAAGGPLETGTSCVCAADDQGNAFSATPSDGISSAPVIPGLGFAVSSRGVQSWLAAGHPSVVRAGKLPFLTPTPGIALKDGRFFIAYGTPGTDTQPQAMAQLLVNVLEFRMDLQQAIDAPRFATYSFPRANDPHRADLGSLYLESRIAAATAGQLAAMGHDIRRWSAYEADAGALCAVMADNVNGGFVAGADPRRLSYAIAW